MPPDAIYIQIPPYPTGTWAYLIGEGGHRFHRYHEDGSPWCGKGPRLDPMGETKTPGGPWCKSSTKVVIGPTLCGHGVPGGHLLQHRKRRVRKKARKRLGTAVTSTALALIMDTIRRSTEGIPC